MILPVHWYHLLVVAHISLCVRDGVDASCMTQMDDDHAGIWTWTSGRDTCTWISGSTDATGNVELLDRQARVCHLDYNGKQGLSH